MSRNPATHGSSHPRPVAEVAVDGLLERADELARRWAVALILARPLDQIGELPLDALAREAPALCAQAILALLSDTELERMAGSGAAGSRSDSASARRLGALAGACDASSAVEAVEALRGVLWEALLEELRDPPARQVADLADRLAHVCATALTVTIVAVAAEQAGAAGDADLLAAGGSRPQGETDQASDGPRAPVLIDERDEIPAASTASASQPDEAAEARATLVRPFPWDMDPFSSREPSRTSDASISPLPAGAPAVRVARAGSADAAARAGSSQPAARAGDAKLHAVSTPQIEIRDQRGEDGPAAWFRSIGRQLERFKQDGLPFAVLLVDLFDLEPPGRLASRELSDLTSEVEAALARELGIAGGADGDGQHRGPDRPIGTLTRERPGRYWLLVTETEGRAVRLLAERLVRALRPVGRRHGVALPFAVGMAACPEDAQDAAALAAHADVGLCDARSAGRSIASARTPAEDLDLSG